MKAVDLYRFVQGPTAWTFTSSNVSAVHNLETYEPRALGRGTIEMKTDIARANIDIAMPIDDDVARAWALQQSDLRLSLTIFRKDDVTTQTIWKGRLGAVKPENSEITFVFETLFTSLRRPGLRARFTRNCRHPLYGRGCWLERSAYAIVGGTVAALTVNTVNVSLAASYPDNYFRSGLIEAADGSLRMITAHTGAALTLARPIASIALAQAVTLYPGCDRSFATCEGRFVNTPNYGGFRYIPIRNPMDGSSVV